MKNHKFTLFLNTSTISGLEADRLFEAGCDDALPGVEDGVAYLDFIREAETFSMAVTTAVRQVESILERNCVVRIEPDINPVG